MKKVSLIFAIVMTVSCMVATAGPKGSSGQVAVLRQGEIFKVIYKGPEASTVRLTILDAEGQSLFSEKVVSNGGFIRPYNFSQLPKGDYVLTIVDQGGTYSEQLSFRDKPWIAHVTRINGEENKFLVAIPHQADHEVVLNIYDQHQQLVYNEKNLLNDHFAKIYHLKDLEGATIHLINKTSGAELFFEVK